MNFGKFFKTAFITIDATGEKEVKVVKVASFVMVTILFSSMFLIGITTSQYSTTEFPHDPPRVYSPWGDLNDDGNIDIFDVVWLAGRYNTIGTPVNKTELLYNVSDRLAELRSQIDDLEWQSRLEISLLPTGAWVPLQWETMGGTIDFQGARLERIDLNPNYPGDQQQIVVSPNATVSINYTAWLRGNPSEIRQLWFSYSWASLYPPWDAYTAIYNGSPYPNTTVSGVLNIIAPPTPGTYKIWLCAQSHYSMSQAVAMEEVPPAMLPHAIITVEGLGLSAPDYDSGWVELPQGADKIFTHNLNTTNVFVYITGKYDSQSPYIHQKEYGGLMNTFGSLLGVYWYDLTSTTVTLHRHGQDLDWNYVRVMMWKIPEH